MLNVLSIVSYNFLPPKMGGQKGIAYFYNFFADKVNLTCVTTKTNDAAFAKNYSLLPILSESKFRYINIFYFFTIKKLIKQNQITHVLIEHPYYGWLSFLIKKFCAVKLIVHSHNIEALRFKSVGKWWWKILWRYEKFTHQQADVNYFIQDDDRNFAINQFNLDAKKCFTITYGFELQAPPTLQQKKEARIIIEQKHTILPSEKILLFNGTLNYKPNLDALKIILEIINPSLQKINFSYKIIVCGSKLPTELNNLQQHINIIYAGFVDDISTYFTAADIFVNPVIDGGGIKTKVVEALGYNMNVISTTSGAIGIPIFITNNKIKIVADNNWEEFTKQIIDADITLQISKDYYDYFYWGSIAEKAVKAIDGY